MGSIVIRVFSIQYLFSPTELFSFVPLSAAANWIEVIDWWGFPGGSVVKNLPANGGDTGLISGSGRFPEVENGYPYQYSCLEKSHGQSSLAGYSPWGSRVKYD